MMDIVMVIGGLVGLFIGGDWLVTGSSRVALVLKISPLVIGLTIVAIGTSAPELLVSIQAALLGSNQLALGNVIGSNIANIGLILGLTGVIAPIAVQAGLIRREIPIMIIVTIFASIITLDGVISRVDGLLLLVGFVVFNLLFYFLAQQAPEAHEDVSDIATSGIIIWREVLRVLLGIGALVIGADLLVDGATSIARGLGISELIIGVTMVALGTSLPELATSLNAAIRGHSDLAVGNVIGSNITNLLLVLGATSAILPIEVNTGETFVEFLVMIGFALLLWPFARNKTLSRRESALFLGAYVAFIIYTFV